MSCGKAVEVWVNRGFHGKLITMKCGNTGIDGYPVLCEECQKTFDRHQYRVDCVLDGESIEEDY